jgi:putative sigma-54 modulation protein
MIIEYTGRNTTVYPKLKSQTEAGIERIGRVTNSCTHAHVILAEDKYRKIAEVTLQCKGESIVSKCEAHEMEQALHDALHKVEQQAIKHKARWETMRTHGQSKEILHQPAA